MAETLSTLSVVSFIIAGISLAAAIFIWVYFKIPTVMGDLSGRNAKKSIARMRATNEKSGKKSYRTSGTNAERGKLTGTMENITGERKELPKAGDMPETGLLSENKAAGGKDETRLLREETELLSAETSLLGEETELLSEGTALLDDSGDEQAVHTEKRISPIKLKMVEEVMLIHTNEVIE